MAITTKPMRQQEGTAGQERDQQWTRDGHIARIGRGLSAGGRCGH
jgi:hypothetical protein